MTVVFDRPYRFVPPHRGNLWPCFIQTFRIVDRYLRRKEGVVDYECRHLERFSESLANDDGILLTPNHCRYADPLVLGWPAREARTHVYAMASWHLFNEGAFDSFAIQKMGGFSINREGSDRPSLETAIEILATAERPLILFPEGTTNRTNDVLKPLLDGVAFIARAAARRRSKDGSGRVVIMPVGMKYLCVDENIDPWVDSQLGRLEQRLGWSPSYEASLLQRIIRVDEALLTLKEIEYCGAARRGPVSDRRNALIAELLERIEQRLQLSCEASSPRGRVRAIRSEVVKRYFDNQQDRAEHRRLRSDAEAADLAQDLLSYPECYLDPTSVTDTRVVETIQRMQESMFGKADSSVPLKAIIEFDEAIEVPTKRPPRGENDPLMVELDRRLAAMLTRLSAEARPFTS